jgi:hypothetical protein
MEIQKRSLVLHLSLIGLISILFSCSPPQEVEVSTLLKEINISNEDTTDGSAKFTGDAHGGKYFSHTDSANKYGSTSVYNIPDSLLQKTIRVKVDMWVKAGDLNQKNQFAVSLENPADNSIVKWDQIVIYKHLSETGKWVNVKDSVNIPGEAINKMGLLIKFFPFNAEGTSYMDVDDIKISVCKIDKKMID